MSRLNWAKTRLRILFRRAAVESELSDEVQLHIDMESDYLVAQGWKPAAARREAVRRLGGKGSTEEAVRESRPLNWLDQLWLDVRLGMRLVRRHPIFSFTVIASLAIGIGANTSIFGLMNAVMWRSLPVPQAEELWKIGDTYPWILVNVLDADETVLEGAAASQRVPISVELEDRTLTVDGRLVSGRFFDVLRVQPALGRLISPADHQIPNGHPVAVLSHDFWSRQFARDPEIVGRTVSLAGAPFTIIGVAQSGFFGVEVGSAADIFVPALMQSTVVPMLGNSPDSITGQFRVLTRLRTGVSPEQAAQALAGPILNAVSVEGRMDFSRLGDTPRAQLQTLGLWPEPAPANNGFSGLRSLLSRPFLILMGAVGVLLLISCANTANLMLARASARRRELATRLALGAGRLRLVRQLLVESLLLAGLGGVFGFGIALSINHVVPALMSRGREPIVIDSSFDSRVLAFTMGVSVLAGILFGLAPIVRSTRSSVISSIKHVPSSEGRRMHLTADRALAVVQMALSLALLIGAGMFVRSLITLNERDSGMVRDEVLIVRMQPAGSGNRFPPEIGERVDATYRDLLQTVRTMPLVRSASLAEFTPADAAGIRRRFTTPAGAEIEVHVPMIYPGYFETMGIPIIGGRDFRSDDLNTDSKPAVIVNEAFARRWFNAEVAPVGRTCPVAVVRSEDACEIVGVVRNSAYANFTESVAPTVYQPFLATATNRGAMALHVRVNGNTTAIATLLRESVLAADPTAPQFQIHTLADEVDAALIRERMLAFLVSTFGALALILASVGLYGLFAYLSVRRKREVGIRIALGARRVDIIAIVLREASTLVATGSLLGIAGGLAMIQVVQSQISGLQFGLDEFDPVSLLGALTILAATAMLAAYLPARTASLTDPNEVVRSD